MREGNIDNSAIRAEGNPPVQSASKDNGYRDEN